MICLLMGQELLEVDLLLCCLTSYSTLFRELSSLSLCFGALFHWVFLLQSFTVTIFISPALCCF